MYSRTLTALAVFLLTICGGIRPARAATLLLAHDGKAAATLVVPAEPPKRLRLAARELQHYVRKLCGVELPIRWDGKAVAATGLYIGRCGPSRESDLPDASLNPESFAIRLRDGNVFFAARTPTATYFAVVSFIEDTLGVRWFAPGDLWEYVPPGTAGELKIEVHETVETPDVSPRFWSGHNFAKSWRAWGLRNKTVNSELAPRRSFQNNLYRVFPPSKYAKSHPEYYPLIDGKRWIPEEGYRYWRPCESNPEVVALTVEAARRHFDTHPRSDSFSLGMDDVSHMCGCPQCRAMDPHPDSYEQHEFSDRHYKFVNAVAREVARTHPDRYIGTLIYAIARKPPETVDRLEDNVFGFITEVSAMWCIPGRMEADHALTREWARRCKHLSRYDYFGLGTFTPRYYPHWMAEQIRFDKSLGVEGMYSELNTFLPHTAPMIWAFAKLEWDASRDIDALLDEFMTRMFGPAAPVMSRYFALLEQAWNDPPPGRTQWEHRNIEMQALAISPDAVEQGMAILNEAMAAADQEPVRQRIDTVRAGLRYAGYAIEEYAQSRKILSTPLTAPEQAAAVLGDCLKTMRLAADREPFWAAARQRSDLLGENIRGLARKNYLMTGRVSTLEWGAVVGGRRVLDWYRLHDPEQLPAVTEKLTATVSCSISDVLRAWLWMEENTPANLLGNPAFDQSGVVPPTTQPSAADRFTPPARWAVCAPSFGSTWWVEPHAGRSGGAAACMANVQDGCYMQTQPVRPGERYLSVAHVSRRPQEVDPHGYLAVRFQKADGSWHPDRQADPRVFMIDEPGWQPLLIVVTVPDQAARIAVQAGAKHQRAASTILFDDVALYRLPDAR